MVGSQVIIVVEGGMVQTVYASRSIIRHTDFLLIDRDGEQIGSKTQAEFIKAVPADELPKRSPEFDLVLEAYRR